jgi:hypothetical protein
VTIWISLWHVEVTSAQEDARDEQIEEFSNGVSQTRRS